MLNGNKTFITNGHYADVAVVIAVTDREKDTHGLSAFVVEKGPRGSARARKRISLAFEQAIPSELIFEDCEIPA